jgi:hypothetical protein
VTQSITNQNASKGGVRRSRRFAVISPIEATWQEADGKILRESGRATEVNAQGGLLELKTYPMVGSQIELANLLTHQSSHARVVGVRRSDEGRLLGIAVELLVPNENFWGVNFQLRKTCADLVKLEYDIRSGSVEPNLLRDFRDAVDNVRKTAWAVQEWQERQLRGQDPQTVLPLLTAETIRRATQLLEAIVSDPTTNEIARETVGIGELYRAIEQAHDRLRQLFDDEKARRDSHA